MQHGGVSLQESKAQQCAAASPEECAGNRREREPFQVQGRVDVPVMPLDADSPSREENASQGSGMPPGPLGGTSQAHARWSQAGGYVEALARACMHVSPCFKARATTMKAATRKPRPVL